jgi:hypothetical protein
LSLATLNPKYAEEEHHPWSPDGRFVVIHDERKLYLLNLETGASVDLARHLGAQTSTHFVQYLGSSRMCGRPRFWCVPTWIGVLPTVTLTRICTASTHGRWS